MCENNFNMENILEHIIRRYIIYRITMYSARAKLSGKHESAEIFLSHRRYQVSNK